MVDDLGQVKGSIYLKNYRSHEVYGNHRLQVCAAAAERLGIEVKEVEKICMLKLKKRHRPLSPDIMHTAILSAGLDTDSLADETMIELGEPWVADTRTGMLAR